MCSAFFSHIENWNIAWTYSILYTCSTFLKQYSCPWRIHCVSLRNIPLIWVRSLIKAIDYLGWVKTLFQVRVVSANQSKWSLGWSMGIMCIYIYTYISTQVNQVSQNAISSKENWVVIIINKWQCSVVRSERTFLKNLTFPNMWHFWEGCPVSIILHFVQEYWFRKGVLLLWEEG